MTETAAAFIAPVLLVHREESGLWVSCPDCAGWTATAPTFDELFALTAEWHAGKHGWSMFESVEPRWQPSPETT